MSPVSPIPAGSHSVQPYLIFDGCAEAMQFYATALGAVEVLRMVGDGRVQHAEMQIGDSVIMMADESPQSDAYSTKHYGGSPVGLMLYTEDCDATYARALSAGAKSLREPADQPYGIRMAAVLDPFGYKWFIGTQIREMTAAELQHSLEPAG